ncbi:MAG: hypothetical protein ACREJQ_01495, partial [bacterium]
YTALAEEAEPYLTAARQKEWLDILEAEHENLRAAIDWALEASLVIARPVLSPQRNRTRQSPPAPNPESRTPNPALSGLHIAGALRRFWMVRGYLSEGRERLAAAIERGQGKDVRARRPALLSPELRAPRRALPESLAILAKALNGAGGLAGLQGDYPAYRTLHEQALAIRRQLGDRGGHRGLARQPRRCGTRAWGL